MQVSPKFDEYFYAIFGIKVTDNNSVTPDTISHLNMCNSDAASPFWSIRHENTGPFKIKGLLIWQNRGKLE